MQNCKLFAQDNIEFTDYHHVLSHINEKLLSEDIVKSSFKQALIDREAQFPTGIEMDGYAIAIPHCEAEHANEPAIYIIRPNQNVLFNRIDADGTVDVSLIIALVVVEPAKQLEMLRKLFSRLQDATFYQQLMISSTKKVAHIFKSEVLNK